MDSIIKKASELGGAIKVWGGILVAIVGGIVQAVWHHSEFQTLKRDFEVFKTDVEKEHNLQNSRSDKRYNRALKIAGKHEEFGMIHENRILSLEIDNAYQKGFKAGVKQK